MGRAPNRRRSSMDAATLQATIGVRDRASHPTRGTARKHTGSRLAHRILAPAPTQHGGPWTVPQLQRKYDPRLVSHATHESPRGPRRAQRLLPLTARGSVDRTATAVGGAPRLDGHALRIIAHSTPVPINSSGVRGPCRNRRGHTKLSEGTRRGRSHATHEGPLGLPARERLKPKRHGDPWIPSCRSASNA